MRGWGRRPQPDQSLFVHDTPMSFDTYLNEETVADPDGNVILIDQRV
jgi:hypothetical protein